MCFDVAFYCRLAAIVDIVCCSGIIPFIYSSALTDPQFYIHSVGDAVWNQSTAGKVIINQLTVAILGTNVPECFSKHWVALVLARRVISMIVLRC
jgi:hypothetical protein